MAAEIHHRPALDHHPQRIRTYSSCSCPSSDEHENLDEQKVEDVTIDFLYRPRTITMMIALTAGLLYRAFMRDYDANQHDNFMQGIIAVVVVFAFLSLLICPNGPFVRPHPAVWRLVLGFGIMYLLFLTFVLFQSYQDVREMMIFLDPSLKNSGPDTEVYANDCELRWELIWHRTDTFVIAHFIGWVVKAIMIRHAGILWLLSIMWEVTEIAFSHLLENFKECWWDSLVLDIMICNGLGIHFGLYLCKKLEMRKYYWESIKDIRGTSKKIKRAVLQFTPASWTHVSWMDPKSTYMRYFAICQLCIMWQISELNTFLLKHIFMVPTKHPVNLYRLILICLMTAPVMRQYYIYVTDTRTKRLGTQCWVFIFVTLLEALVCIRHGMNLFSNTDMLKIASWIAFQFIISCFTVYLMVLWRKWKNRYTNIKSTPTAPSDSAKSSPEEKQSANDRNLTSILKHKDSPRARRAKGVEFQDSSSEEEAEQRFTRVTRRRIIKTRSRTTREGKAEEAGDM
eukprot:Seg120.6 transcript_id=Seg120.6/GoldUCD/mRNA.D3Y31 product="Phosphatidylserine synthase 1" protein_id=Seg120.6/GoldUCD/D3Y31